jgi:hypothetical protein
MLIVSLPIRVQGVETLAHFRFSPAVSVAAKCDGCGAKSRAVLRPVVLFEDNPEHPTDDGLPLCKACSMGSTNLANAEWPALNSREREEVWAMVAAEQVREALCQTAREQAVAVSLDELQQATARALEQARVNQGVNDLGKVA